MNNIDIYKLFFDYTEEQKKDFKILKNIADSINFLFSSHEAQKLAIEMLTKQILTLVINFGDDGKIKDMDHIDLRQVDIDKIGIGTGMSSVTIYRKDNNSIIKNWQDVPKR